MPGGVTVVLAAMAVRDLLGCLGFSNCPTQQKKQRTQTLPFLVDYTAAGDAVTSHHKCSVRRFVRDGRDGVLKYGHKLTGIHLTSVACNHSRIVFEDAKDGLQDVRVQHAVVAEDVRSN